MRTERKMTPEEVERLREHNELAVEQAKENKSYAVVTMNGQPWYLC